MNRITLFLFFKGVQKGHPILLQKLPFPLSLSFAAELNTLSLFLSLCSAQLIILNSQFSLNYLFLPFQLSILFKSHSIFYCHLSTVMFSIIIFTLVVLSFLNPLIHFFSSSRATIFLFHTRSSVSGLFSIHFYPAFSSCSSPAAYPSISSHFYHPFFSIFSTSFFPLSAHTNTTTFPLPTFKTYASFSLLRSNISPLSYHFPT